MTAPWHEQRLLAFDTETSGIDVDSDRIVTAAAILVGGGRSRESRGWLSDVDGLDIPQAATDIHHVTTEHARANGLPAKQVIEDVVTVLAECVTAGTIIISLVDREARRHLGVGLPDVLPYDRLRIVDTRVLDQQMLPFRRRVSATQGARQLITVAAVYGFPWDEAAAHGADYDALMSARIAFRIGQIAQTPKADRPDVVRSARQERFDSLAGLDIDALHSAQVGWAAEQAAGLQEFFRRSDPAAVVDPHWPLIPFVTAEEATV